MFCPSCGLEESQLNQFCRACGADLRVVRVALERPDTITQSAISAREEIGRAFAAKIRETETATALKVAAEDILPQIEKFLESPAEKRLRRVRTGTLITSIGLGAAIAFALISVIKNDEGFMIAAAMGIVTFLIGLGFAVNGLFFTEPKKTLADNFGEAQTQRAIDFQTPTHTSELQMPEARAQIFSSVTEHTTQHLKEKQPLPNHKI